MVRRPITDAERQEAYTHAIHSLINTTGAVRESAQLALAALEKGYTGGNPEHTAEFWLNHIIDLTTGRLERETERLQPTYTGYVKEQHD